MSGRRPDGSYGPEYGPLPPEHEYASYYQWPSRGRVSWPMFHGDYPGRLLEQRVRREPFGLFREAMNPWQWTLSWPLAFVTATIYDMPQQSSCGAMINTRPRREDTGLTDDEFRKAMEQLKQQTFRPSNPQKIVASNRGGRGIVHTRSASTEAPPNTEEEKACTVCLETFLPGEQVVVTPCNHMFHQGCISPWVKEHGNCPVCRFTLCER